MNRIPQQEVRDLLKQIRDKTSVKDQRLQACQQLCMLIANCNHKSELNNDWNDMVDEVLSIISPKPGSITLKQAAGRLAAQLAALDISQFSWIVSTLKEDYKNCRSIAVDERAILVTILADSIQLLGGQRNIYLSEQQVQQALDFALCVLADDDSHVVLVAVIDLCSIIAELYPHVFAPQFELVVDYVIGWMVDKVPASVTARCSAFLVSLRPLWDADQSYGKELMEKFTEDVSVFVTDSLDGSRRALLKARSIMLTLSTVLELFLGFEQDPVRAAETIVHIVQKSLTACRAHMVTMSCLSSSAVADFFSAFPGVFLVLAKIYGHSERSQKLLSECVDATLHLARKYRTCQSALVRFLNFFGKLFSIPGLPSAVTLPLTESLVGGGSLCLVESLILHNQTAISYAVTNLLTSLLSPTDLPVLQAAYGYIRETVMNDLAELRRESSSYYCKRALETRISVYVSAFTMVGGASLKNSLIVMMGMRPSLLSLLVEEVPIRDPWFITSHPVLFFMMLKMTYKHVLAHDFFLANSEWLLDGQRSTVMGESLTSKHAQIQLEAITALLKLKLWDSHRSTISRWLYDMVMSLDDAILMRIAMRPEWKKLRLALRDTILAGKCDDNLRAVADRLAVMAVRDDRDAASITLAVARKVRTLKQKEGVELWKQIDSRHYIKCAVSVGGWDAWEMGQSRLPPTSFGAEDFVFLTDFLLKRIVPSYSKSPMQDTDWMLDSLIELCGSTQKDARVPANVDVTTANVAQKWRYALAQMAAYCVENKMKTPLGKPMDTFNQFGAELQRLAKEALRLEPQTTKAPEGVRSPNGKRMYATDDDDDGEYGKSRSLTPTEEWWRVRCLLEFVEILDKLIFNAHTGAMFTICNVSQLARQFFVTNVVSCREWLCRTYSSAMVVAYHSGYYAQVIRFGAAAMADLEKRHIRSEAATKSDDSSKTLAPASQPPPPLAFAVLGWTARAMAELGAEQSAKGLRQWAKKLYKQDMRWLEAAELMAAAKYEPALASLCRSLTDTTLPDSAKTIMRQMSMDVLARLRVPLLLEPSTCPLELSLWSIDEKASGASDVPPGFDADAINRLRQLCHFSKVDRMDTNLTTWDLSQRMDDTEMQLMHPLRRIDVQALRDELSVVGRAVLVGDPGLRLHGRVATVDRIASAVMTRMGKKTHPGDFSESILDDLSPDFLVGGAESQSDVGERLRIAVRLGLWAERLAGGVSVHAETARLARKTGNIVLATQMLHKAVATAAPHDSTLAHLMAATQRAKMNWMDGGEGERAVEWSNTLAALANAYQVDIHNKNMLNMIGENHFANGFEALQLSPNGMNHRNAQYAPPNLAASSDLMARTTLRLARWLKEQPTVLNGLPVEYMNTPLWAQLDAFRREMGGDLVGSLLATARQMAPRLAKAHLQLADWAHTQAEAGEDKSMFCQNYTVILGVDVSQSVLDGLWAALRKATSPVQLEKEVLAAMPNDQSTARSLVAGNSHFVALWTQLRQRRSVYYTCAVAEYFAFLAHSAGPDGSAKSSMGSVSATLRILDLLVKYADLLQNVIEDGLAATNEHLWKDILPQLFSRLSHPVREVRESIIGLLSRVCRSSPHSMVFQVVAGAATTSLEADDDVVDEERDEDDEGQQKRSLMLECCGRLESFLQQWYPALARDVKEFVAELQKINLLYEEKWTFVLSNLDHDMDKRLEQIRSESARSLQANHLDEKTKIELVAEKTRLITSSVYRILTDLYERTCVRPPSTNNERAFVDTYGDAIRIALEQSKSNRKSPEKAWAPFKQVLNLMIQRNARRGGQTLYLSDISESLGKLTKSSVPLPGQDDKDYSQVVSLSRVGGTIQILPTKTRPKKISFTGSDGQEHVFLFKGQEDLHLDERVMQLLHICNLMMGGSARRSWPSYNAQHYAVTPLGTRSGLIQWVAGATPLFVLYRKWQLRQAQLKNALEKGKPTATEAVERPTDLYQKTLRTAFAVHGVDPSIVADRSKWPVDVMKEVLRTMMKETPNDLLSREIWLRAGSGDTWWRASCRFARSSAVMSMVGAVLGLGDRHLDNLLVNLDSGNVVHIDYNVCFDKGKNLRVPETVPFRLTQNMVNAMGPTQVEGVFRESCSHVLSVLRASRLVLLTVLDAFVYDPLVDWTAADHLTSTSAAVGVAVTLAVYGTDSRAKGAKPLAREMFSLRVKELAVPWLRNCAELTEALNNVRNVLDREANKVESSAWNSQDMIDMERVEAGRRLKATISAHHQMMKDFRPLLRALATCDDRFAAYVRSYRELFSEPLVRGHHLLDAQPVDLPACVRLFGVVLANVNSTYTGLVLLDSAEPPRLMSPIASQLTPMAPPPGLEDSLSRNQQQEQNAHARSVVRRVRARLEGRMDGPDGFLMVDCQEQADSLIRQATSNSLLSLMYEGWTAWV